jgi:hypothetical protein
VLRCCNTLFLFWSCFTVTQPFKIVYIILIYWTIWPTMVGVVTLVRARLDYTRIDIMLTPPWSKSIGLYASCPCHSAFSKSFIWLFKSVDWDDYGESVVIWLYANWYYVDPDHCRFDYTRIWLYVIWYDVRPDRTDFGNSTFVLLFG